MKNSSCQREPLFKKPVVFVVEDNNAYRILISNILIYNGYEVIQFACAIEALKNVANYRPNIIVSDIQMPLMNGFEFFEALVKTYPTDLIPFIYISSTNKEEDKKRALQLSNRAVMAKPVMGKDLCNAINEVLYTGN